MLKALHIRNVQINAISYKKADKNQVTESAKFQLEILLLFSKLKNVG